jgi:uncharacterized membrane protein (UPF0136 family)
MFFKGEQMKSLAIIQLLYGIIAIVGGIIGYVSAKSTVSLIMGIVSGLIILTAAYMLFQNNFTGVYIALVISLILSIVFAIRFTKSFSFMPSGLMLLLSVISLGFSIYSLTKKSEFLP